MGKETYGTPMVTACHYAVTASASINVTGGGVSFSWGKKHL